MGHVLFSDVVAGDFEAYYYGTKAALDGDALYLNEQYSSQHGEFIYPPVTLLYFAVYTLFPFTIAYGIQLVVSLVAASYAAWAAVQTIRTHRSLSRTDSVLIGLFFLFSACSLAALSLGQINLLLLALLVFGYRRLADNEQLAAGASFAVAAIPKLFPGLLGLYLLSRRAWRAALSAIAVGVGGMLVGALVFGYELTRNYFVWLVTNRGIKTGTLSASTPPSEDLYIVTLMRPLANVFPSLDVSGYFVLSLVLLLPVLGYVYAGVSGVRDDLVAFLATLVVMVILVPPQLIYGVFIYFPLVVLYYLTHDHRRRAIFGVSLVLINVIFVPEQFATALQALSLPSPFVADVIGVVRPLLGFASVPLLGFLAALLGCVVHRATA
ncbi:glycosyltransferase family 87 protein [Halorussus aquaticus]|uniref:glycosyltransferase family 87 protein n=1 Tax=Halorussus aquaticus TaxID=2953748 RepID=UPI0020B78117|nr:glycosyltransferase family 87 protein [Halorussus aquaticus]